MQSNSYSWLSYYYIDVTTSTSVPAAPTNKVMLMWVIKHPTPHGICKRFRAELCWYTLLILIYTQCLKSCQWVFSVWGWEKVCCIPAGRTDIRMMSCCSYLPERAIPQETLYPSPLYFMSWDHHMQWEFLISCVKVKLNL